MAGHKRKVDEARSRSGAAVTRELAKRRRQELQAHPIDWAEQWASIRNFMDDLDRRYPR